MLRTAGWPVFERRELAEPVLLPHLVAVIDQVGVAIQRQDNLDLVEREAVAKMQAVQAIPGHAQQATVADGVGVQCEFHPAR